MKNIIQFRSSFLAVLFAMLLAAMPAGAMASQDDIAALDSSPQYSRLLAQTDNPAAQPLMRVSQEEIKITAPAAPKDDPLPMSVLLLGLGLLVVAAIMIFRRSRRY